MGSTSNSTPGAPYLTVNGHVNYQSKTACREESPSWRRRILTSTALNEVGILRAGSVGPLTGLHAQRACGSITSTNVPAQDYPGETTGWAGAARVNPWIPPTRSRPWRTCLRGRTSVHGSARRTTCSATVGRRLKVTAGGYVAKTNTLVTQGTAANQSVDPQHQPLVD